MTKKAPKKTAAKPAFKGTPARGTEARKALESRDIGATKKAAASKKPADVALEQLAKVAAAVPSVTVVVEPVKGKKKAVAPVAPPPVAPVVPAPPPVAAALEKKEPADRSAAAKRAWITIRANRAAKAAGTPAASVQ
ncbi:MAG TPA: hypothetical protein VK641_15315 [Terriglobales bacterium]|nr:hypothetical protein [Terriglobales bacterium]